MATKKKAKKAAKKTPASRTSKKATSFRVSNHSTDGLGNWAETPVPVAVEPVKIAMMKRDDDVRFVMPSSQGLEVGYVYLTNSHTPVIVEVTRAQRAAFTVSVEEWGVDHTLKFYFAVPALLGEDKTPCVYLLTDDVYRAYCDSLLTGDAFNRSFRVVKNDDAYSLESAGKFRLSDFAAINVRSILTRDTANVVFQARAQITQDAARRDAVRIEQIRKSRSDLTNVFDALSSIRALVKSDDIGEESLVLAVELMAEAASTRVAAAVHRLGGSVSSDDADDDGEYDCPNPGCLNYNSLTDTCPVCLGDDE